MLKSLLILLSSSSARIIGAASKILVAGILLLALALMIAFVDSFRFNPDQSGDANFMARAQHKSVPGIKVNVSALGAGESRQSFGENLAGQNIQLVWLSIQNETEEPLAFLPIPLDPDYYSARLLQATARTGRQCNSVIDFRTM